MGKPGKTVPSLKKPLGLEMKGSPYPMTASQENTFGPSGSNSNPVIFNAIKAADAQKSTSEGPEFVGALLAGAGKFLIKKALPAIVKAGAGVAKTAASGVGEGLSGVAAGLKDKVGGGGKGAFKEKVGNYVKSLDLITNSKPDGSIRKDGPSTAADSDKNIANTEVDLGKRNPDTTVGADLKMPNLALDQSAIPNQQKQDRGIIPGGQDYSKGLAPLNKLKNMCRR